jgi:dipeptidase E
MKLLLLSNSTLHGEPYLGWPINHIEQFLGKSITKVAFVPYAAVTFSYDKYEEMVNAALSKIGVEVSSIHHHHSPKHAIEEAEAIIIGGGNSFRLLQQLYELDLIQSIRQKMNQNTPYIGWSAGANMACPTIKTTNDMPIVEPKSFEALKLISFQINPHYTELTIADHGGESRLQRLQEYAAINEIPVACLPEGCGILVENGEHTLISKEPIKVIRQGGTISTVTPGKFQI